MAVAPEQRNYRRHKSLSMAPLVHVPESASLAGFEVPSDVAMTLDLLNVFAKRTFIGGEGVMYMLKEIKRGSGYWFLTFFCVHGRASGGIVLLLYMAYCTVVVSVIQSLFRDQMISSPSVLLVFSSCQAALQLVSTALFFLLTFRTNSAYQRWWEGRSAFDAISSAINAISRIVAGKGVKSKKLGRRLLRWTAAFLLMQKQALRHTYDLDEVIGLLNNEEFEGLQDAPVHLRWLHCLMKLQETFYELCERKLVPVVIGLSELGIIIQGLQTSCANIYRVASTPMPFAYICHLRTFLLVWLCVLPFVFIYQFGWGTLIVCFFIGFGLLGMEAISLEIEYPFGNDFNDLPIDNNIHELFKTLLWAHRSIGSLPDDDDGMEKDGIDWHDYSILRETKHTSRVKMPSMDEKINEQKVSNKMLNGTQVLGGKATAVVSNDMMTKSQSRPLLSSKAFLETVVEFPVEDIPVDAVLTSDAQASSAVGSVNATPSATPFISSGATSNAPSAVVTSLSAGKSRGSEAGGRGVKVISSQEAESEQNNLGAAADAASGSMVSPQPARTFVRIGSKIIRSPNSDKIS
ncbi:hypothetical protein CEUSTIGMA_g6474.t1 [Chlamydomonas eustigma]|uniref:Bestrophin homolog n=1 Tax=Chlamydomonas eustigma TaxID=1157962 RepID=A0A250X7H1_9CHLO|nr:hypothetical protein CEUSTIGMA_g6474.t1 [Chlamydomonas eustigma]|eukprot:GAX79034.1 hypothetical protein CEUSTIGMA_g6474.t1 [Chlamydomonas eustigma]